MPKPKPLFHVLVSDFDNRVVFITELVSDDSPWTDQVEALQDAGRDITCQTVPVIETVNPRLAVEAFCHQHGLTLTDRPFLKVKS